MNGPGVQIKRKERPYPVLPVKLHHIINTTTPDGAIGVDINIPIFDIMHSIKPVNGAKKAKFGAAHSPSRANLAINGQLRPPV
jgi:hypothetical protein